MRVRWGKEGRRKEGRRKEGSTQGWMEEQGGEEGRTFIPPLEQWVPTEQKRTKLGVG